MTEHGTCFSLCIRRAGVLVFLLATCKVSGLIQKIIMLSHGNTYQYGTFSSPNYPLSYPESFTKDWLLKAPHGYKISVNIKQIDLWRCYFYQDNPNCSAYDSVKVFVVPSKKTLGHFCNGHFPERPLSTVEGNLVVRFKTLKTREQCRGDGFMCSYEMKYQSPSTLEPTTKLREAISTTDVETSGYISSSEILVIVIVGVAILIAVIVLPLYCWYGRRNTNNGRIPSRRNTPQRRQSRNFDQSVQTPLNDQMVEPTGSRSDPNHSSLGESSQIILPSYDSTTAGESRREFSHFPRRDPRHVVLTGPPPAYQDGWNSRSENQTGSTDIDPAPEVEAPPSYEEATNVSLHNTADRNLRGVCIYTELGCIYSIIRPSVVPETTETIENVLSQDETSGSSGDRQRSNPHGLSEPNMSHQPDGLPSNQTLDENEQTVTSPNRMGGPLALSAVGCLTRNDNRDEIFV